MKMNIKKKKNSPAPANSDYGMGIRNNQWQCH